VCQTGQVAELSSLDLLTRPSKGVNVLFVLYCYKFDAIIAPHQVYPRRPVVRVQSSRNGVTVHPALYGTSKFL